MLENVDETRRYWLMCPDGKQLLPEFSYYGQCLSGEVPGSFLTAYWKRRKI